MPEITAPRGTRDLLPAESPAWEWLHRVHTEVASAHGYGLVDTPIFEHTEVFERGVGAGTDVVDKEMYTFTDRGGRSVTLRPEGTAGVVRAVMNAHLLDQLRPLRLRYAGPMFRYDRPQKGRYRQFFQVGIECIGESSPHLDAEVIEVGWRFLAALGLKGVSLQVNSLGDIDDRARHRQALLAYYEPLESQLCEDCRRRLRINPLRLLDCKADARFAAAAPALGEHLGDASRAHFDAVLESLRAAGIDTEVNPRLVRGLDYYAHTAFEYWHTSLQGAQNALGGGGRYDGLAEVMGFPATPGVGYAFGVERLLAVATDTGVPLPSVASAEAVVLTAGEARASLAAQLARTLRAAGIRTVLDAAERRLDRKLRNADRLGARVAVIVGEEEERTGMPVVRDLRERSQAAVPTTEMADHVRRLTAEEE